jgi:hypothetical protein
LVVPGLAVVDPVRDSGHDVFLAVQEQTLARVPQVDSSDNTRTETGRRGLEPHPEQEH